MSTKLPLKTRKFEFPDNAIALKVCGPSESHLTYLKEKISVSIKSFGNKIVIEGNENKTDLAYKCLQTLSDMALQGRSLNLQDVSDCLRGHQHPESENLETLLKQQIISSFQKKTIYPKTFNQKNYVDAILNHDIVFGVGPAGTGKTYLAMAVAMAELLKGRVERIILTRPAVEAGERLGFLPGDLVEKVNPYLKPLYDALHDMVDHEKAGRMLASGQIEVAPLAFMRGRTLNGSFVILDEAQNTTREQMKMFLTRLGIHSKAVITGDVTQVDLPREQMSGLIDALKKLSRIRGIAFHYFDERDVVRHSLVAEIIKAYDKADRLPSGRV